MSTVPRVTRRASTSGPTASPGAAGARRPERSPKRFDEGGPFFDDLAVGDVFDWAPSVTLTEGFCAAHHAILGGRFRLALDRNLSERVAGRPLVSPALAWDVSIGQSTLVTQRALANLFYRNLRFRRLPSLGDTLHTRAEIVGLRSAARKEGREARGLVVLRIRMEDQDEIPVLDYFRCALLPDRRLLESAPAGLLDPAEEAPDFSRAADGWNLSWLRSKAMARFPMPAPGETRTAPGDLVSNAPELARLTLNLAAVHHDAAAAGGTRLVYGGHTIGLAAAQASRLWPNLATILGWHSCDHLGPVREGEVLRTTFTVERLESAAEGSLAHIRALVHADGAPAPRPVLDWRFAALFA